MFGGKGGRRRDKGKENVRDGAKEYGKKRVMARIVCVCSVGVRIQVSFKMCDNIYIYIYVCVWYLWQLVYVWLCVHDECACVSVCGGKIACVRVCVIVCVRGGGMRACVCVC